MVTRPFTGRLHCGEADTLIINHGTKVIRSTIGRLHWSNPTVQNIAIEEQLIRPITGRLHCGAADGAAGILWVLVIRPKPLAGSIAVFTCARRRCSSRRVTDRSSVGSIAAICTASRRTTAPWSPGR